MILKTGNMFNSGADVIVVTGNSTVKRDGCLVMGRGAAWKASQLYPDCPRVFGMLIRAYEKKDPLSPYCLLVHPNMSRPILALFQVKKFWGDGAELSIISESAGTLFLMAKTMWKNKRIAMNFPGIGWGRLKREDVLPIIQGLPDNVEVWEYPR